MNDLREILDKTYFGIAVWQYAGALISILAGFTLKPIVLALVARARKFTEKTKTGIDDVVVYALEKPIGLAAVLTGVAVAMMILPLPEMPVNVHRFVMAAFKSAYIVLAVWVLLRMTDRLTDLWSKRAANTDTRLDDQMVPLVRNASRTFLVIIGGVIIVQSLGYSVTSLVAGLGIGGAAIALASKDTIANVFGSIVIFVDRPFQVGDWIELGDKEGTVEEVGLRTTRIRTFANSLITIPNAQFTTVAVNNWSRMRKRRIKTTIGLTYSTTPEQMASAVEAVRDVIRNDSRIHQDFFLVNFTDLSAYSLDILIYCFTVTTNWAEHLQARQELLLKVMNAIKALGLEFAFPTQSLHVESLPGAPEAMNGDLPR